jgi:hypothetical protein
MTKDFVKFMAVVIILYIGFLTTFTLLARDTFSLAEMSWILIKVFFGSSYIGFDAMNDISPALGPPLMLVFVTMTNILLVTSLISILSSSFSRVINHAREEYMFVYSVYVLEASTSKRLTHFYPPLNLVPLILVLPLQLCGLFTAEHIRAWRILVLRITHAPIVGLIVVYERGLDRFFGSNRDFAKLISSGSEQNGQGRVSGGKGPTTSAASNGHGRLGSVGSDGPAMYTGRGGASTPVTGQGDGDQELSKVSAKILEERLAGLGDAIAQISAILAQHRGGA